MGTRDRRTTSAMIIWTLLTLVTDAIARSLGSIRGAARDHLGGRPAPRDGQCGIGVRFGKAPRCTATPEWCDEAATGRGDARRAPSGTATRAIRAQTLRDPDGCDQGPFGTISTAGRSGRWWRIGCERVGDRPARGELALSPTGVRRGSADADKDRCWDVHAPPPAVGAATGRAQSARPSGRARDHQFVRVPPGTGSRHGKCRQSRARRQASQSPTAWSGTIPGVSDRGLPLEVRNRHRLH